MVFDLFARLVAQGKTILMVTHDQDLAQRVTRTILLADGEIIDEYVAKALPGLTADQLVELSYHLEPRSLAPGAIIIHEGEPPTSSTSSPRGVSRWCCTILTGRSWLWPPWGRASTSAR